MLVVSVWTQTEDNFIHQHVFVCLIFIISSPCPLLLYRHLLVSVLADLCSVAPSWTAAMTREEYLLKDKVVTERWWWCPINMFSQILIWSLTKYNPETYRGASVCVYVGCGQSLCVFVGQQHSWQILPLTIPNTHTHTQTEPGLSA